jgi:hypothetical protein
MKSKAKITFKITSWNEEPISEQGDGGKLARVQVTSSYRGELKGQGELEYVMAYKSDGSATFMGYEKVQGSLSGKSGSFVFEHRGEFKKGVVNSTWSILEESGSGALAGLKGKVVFSAGHQDEYSITLNYEL